MQMMIAKANKVECYSFFPITAVSVHIRISDITPPGSAVLIYTPKTQEPVRFNGPETTAYVPVSGYEMYAQSVLGNTGYRLECLGYKEDF